MFNAYMWGSENVNIPVSAFTLSQKGVENMSFTYIQTNSMTFALRSWNICADHLILSWRSAVSTDLTRDPPGNKTVHCGRQAIWPNQDLLYLSVCSNHMTIFLNKWRQRYNQLDRERFQNYSLRQDCFSFLASTFNANQSLWFNRLATNNWLQDWCSNISPSHETVEFLNRALSLKSLFFPTLLKIIKQQ